MPIKHDVCETCDEHIEEGKLIRLRIGSAVCVSLCSIECLREYIDEVDDEDNGTDGEYLDEDEDEDDE